MLPRVERIRGLDSTRDIPGVAIDRPGLISRIRQHVAIELPAGAIRNEGRELQLLGFLDTGFDYEAAEYQLLEDQLAGFYEPGDRTMYLASDLEPQDADATLAHELVHALQDQRWHLDELSRYRPGESDFAAAIGSLAEGDATSAMLDFVIESNMPGSKRKAPDMPDELCEAQFREGFDRGRRSSIPAIMTRSLIAPYLYGTLFVHALRRQGGWDEVNRAWSNLPTTTEQILHVDKWRVHEPPVHVGAPPFASLGSGWLAIDQDSEGELGTRIAFEQWLGASSAAACSAPWGGDRGVLVENGDRTAFAWRVRYDPGKSPYEHSQRVFPVLAEGLSQHLGPPAVHKRSLVCFERHELGPLALGVEGPDLLLVAGPARTSARGPWSSDATCSLAQTWIKEIASAQ